MFWNPDCELIAYLAIFSCADGTGNFEPNREKLVPLVPRNPYCNQRFSSMLFAKKGRYCAKTARACEAI